MRRKNAAVLMTAVIIGGLLTSCGSAYNNANGKNSDNTVETQTTVRTVVNGETKTDGNNVKTADKETGDFTQEVTSEENNLTDNDIAGNTEASEQQAFDDLSQAKKGADSSSMRASVTEAISRQRMRYKDDGILFNSQLKGSRLSKYCHLDQQKEELLRQAFESMGLSVRARDRILRVSRTIADLEGSEQIKEAHLAEAISYRSIDRKYWGEM